MGVCRPVAWLLLALVVAMPGAVLASRGLGRDDAPASSAQLQHTTRSATAWRNFSTGLVAEPPRIVSTVGHFSLPSDVIVSRSAVVDPIFIPPRG
jgi:hypothetical protein